MTTIETQWPGIDKLNFDEFEALERAAEEIGTPGDCLAAVISFETANTFSPSIRNTTSGATGLIQFMPFTARSLDTTTDELANMSFEEQLPFVVKYFSRIRVEAFPTCELLYLGVFAPDLITRPNSFVLSRAGQPIYEQNKGLDLNRDGTLTRGDIVNFFRGFVSRHTDAVSKPSPGVPSIERPPTRKKSRDDLLFWGFVFTVVIATVLRVRTS